MSSVVVEVVPAGNSGSAGAQAVIWSSLKIRKSLDEICHSVELEIPVSEKLKIHKHDKIIVWYLCKHITESSFDFVYRQKARRITTVMVDSIADSTDASSKSVTVYGRSPARDIIDSKWSGAIMGNPDLLKVLTEIAKPFDITVYHMPTNQNNTNTISSFSWENESPWTKLLTEADNQGYIITSNQKGELYLTKVGNTPATGFFVTEGVNTASVESEENGAEQYHTYIVKACGNEATVTDSTCKNKRIFTINLTDFVIGEDKLKRRAQTEMLRRRENKIKITVPGLGLTDRQIASMGSTSQKEIFWEVNFLIPVNLHSHGVNANMLVSQVEYTIDASSCHCNITVVKPEAYK